MSVFVEITVGDGDGMLSPSDAQHAADIAAEAGIEGIIVRDNGIDPSVVVSHLAGRHEELRFVVEASTSHNPPFNLARRILSIDRATSGRAGLLLAAGDGDEVTDPTSALSGTHDEHRARRWSEYAEVLTQLWESFPANALRGDQNAEILADSALITAIDHAGEFYRVAGPLDGPSSPQGRPVLVAADPATIGWSRVAEVADAAVVDVDRYAAARADLEAVAVVSDLHRDQLALLVRVATDADVGRASQSSAEPTGLLLAVAQVADIATLLQSVRRHFPGALFTASREATLRSALGIAEFPQSVVNGGSR